MMPVRLWELWAAEGMLWGAQAGHGPGCWEASRGIHMFVDLSFTELGLAPETAKNGKNSQKQHRAGPVLPRSPCFP